MGVAIWEGTPRSPLQDPRMVQSEARPGWPVLLGEAQHRVQTRAGRACGRGWTRASPPLRLRAGPWGRASGGAAAQQPGAHSVSHTLRGATASVPQEVLHTEVTCEAEHPLLMLVPTVQGHAGGTQLTERPPLASSFPTCGHRGASASRTQGAGRGETPPARPLSQELPGGLHRSGTPAPSTDAAGRAECSSGAWSRLSGRETPLGGSFIGRVTGRCPPPSLPPCLPPPDALQPGQKHHLLQNADPSQAERRQLTFIITVIY